MFFETKNLQVYFGKVEVLKNVSLGMDERMIACVIGSNGAGKTTMLRTISGLKTPTSGEIWFDGQRIETLPCHEIVKRGISHVPEGRRIFPKMAVIDNLLVGCYLRRDRKKIREDVDEIFLRFPILKARQKQMGGSLSGGEQQMLTIARALMSKPRLLLLDEPTVGLSPMLVSVVADIVKSIEETGVTIILVEQNSRVALRLAHKAYVLELGSVTIEGKPSDLLNNEYLKKAYLGA
jgi:branched-chain amino acid transport system ATP-binding protein